MTEEINPWEPGDIVHLGGDKRDYVTIRVNSRSNAPDYWDGNWMVCIVEVHAGGFRGQFEANLRTDEFERFHNEVKPLYDKLTGKAAFRAMEEQLVLELEGDGRGHIHIRGQACDMAGTGNTLNFKLDIDQTQLFGTMAQVGELLNRFPVRGSPDEK